MLRIINMCLFNSDICMMTRQDTKVSRVGSQPHLQARCARELLRRRRRPRTAHRHRNSLRRHCRARRSRLRPRRVLNRRPSAERGLCTTERACRRVGFGRP